MNTKKESKAVSAFGIECPFFRKGDDIVNIIVDSVLASGVELDDYDALGITESVIARVLDNTVSVDELSDEVRRVTGRQNPELLLYNPIYSRNRFAVILRGFARACKRIVLAMPLFDEVGNIVTNHPFTGVKDYRKLYEGICEEENCECTVIEDVRKLTGEVDAYVDCTLHNNGLSILSLQSWRRFEPLYTLMDFFSDKCEWGVLGSNKLGEERLKLFPSRGGAQAICDMVKEKLMQKTGKSVVVCCYGDGCFKSPEGIWEFADPVTMPAYTNKELIESTPNEIKLKALIDSCEDDFEVDKVLSEKRGENKDNERTMGTTPRMRRDLLASLFDLMSGSGDRKTPCVIVKNYF